MKILINTYNTIEVVDTDSILYAHSLEQVNLVTLDNAYTIVDSLNTLDSKLKQKGFFRCHKSYLVNLNHVVRIINRQEIEITNGERLSLARRRAAEFFEELNGFLK